MDVDVNPLCYAFMFDTKLCSQSIDSAGLQVLWRTERVPYSTVQQLRACDPNMLLNKVLETKCKTKCHHQGGANRAILHVTVPRVSWNVLVPFLVLLTLCSRSIQGHAAISFLVLYHYQLVEPAVL